MPVPRPTICNSVAECTAPVTAVDVSVPSNLSVQVRNPNGTSSNSVSLTVIAPNAADEIISLTGTAPFATAKDIILVDPTTAGVSPSERGYRSKRRRPRPIFNHHQFLLARRKSRSFAAPATGVATTDICLFSASGLDTSMITPSPDPAMFA